MSQYDFLSALEIYTGILTVHKLHITDLQSILLSQCTEIPLASVNPCQQNYN